MRPIVIIGTGGSAYDVLDIVDAINAVSSSWTVIGFLDDFRPVGSLFLDRPVLGGLVAAERIPDAQFINVIGSDKTFSRRPELINTTGLSRERFATLVHPGAGVSSRARIGCGVYVNYGASVAGNVEIEDHVALGPGSIVG